jgi:hypothetical protein
MVLAQKLTGRPMDQNRRSRHKPTQLQPIDLWQRSTNTQWISSCIRLKVDSCLSPCTKINSKWIKKPNIKTETLKQLQEAVGITPEHIDIGNDS